MNSGNVTYFPWVTPSSFTEVCFVQMIICCLDMVYYVSQCHLYKLCCNWVPKKTNSRWLFQARSKTGWGCSLWLRTISAGILSCKTFFSQKLRNQCLCTQSRIWAVCHSAHPGWKMPYVNNLPPNDWLVSFRDGAILGAQHWPLLLADCTFSQWE